MPGDPVDIEEQRRLEEQRKLKRQNEKQRSQAINEIRGNNVSQEHLRSVAKAKAAKLYQEADALDKQAEEVREKLNTGALSSFVLLEGALLECVAHLEIWNEANNKRYIASWYDDRKWGPRLIQAGDFVNKYLDPKNIPHAIQAAGEKIAEKTGLPKKYYDSKYGVKDKPITQQLYFDYKFDDGKVELLMEEDSKLNAKLNELDVKGNLKNILEIALHARGFDKKPADNKYYKVDIDGNLTDEVITEEQFNDVVGILKSNFDSEDNQALMQFKEDTGAGLLPHINKP